MAAKPYHAGHDALVRLAAEENDIVHLFISTGDRGRIRGTEMLVVWKKYLEPSLPKNVKVKYVDVPVGCVYAELEAAEQKNADDQYLIYSDARDILRYRESSLKKSAPNIFMRRQIGLRGVDRSQTVQISATEMRNFLEKADLAGFVDMLPRAVRRHGAEIFRCLKFR